MNGWSHEETNEPLLADHHNYYKVEKWTKAGRVERMLYAGNNLDRRASPSYCGDGYCGHCCNTRVRCRMVSLMRGR